MGIEDQVNNSYISSPPLASSARDFAYQERTLIIYKKCWIAISILIFVFFASFIVAVIVNPKGDKTAIIFLVLGLIIFELVIQFVSSGLKIGIDNLNKRIEFKRTGLFSCKGCCGNKAFAFSDVQHVNYDITKGVYHRKNSIKVEIDVTLRDGSVVAIYKMRTSGSCTSEYSAGVPFDIKETMEFINNLIDSFNQNRIC